MEALIRRELSVSLAAKTVTNLAETLNLGIFLTLLLFCSDLFYKLPEMRDPASIAEGGNIMCGPRAVIFRVCPKRKEPQAAFW